MVQMPKKIKGARGILLFIAWLSVAAAVFYMILAASLGSQGNAGGTVIVVILCAIQAGACFYSAAAIKKGINSGKVVGIIIGIIELIAIPIGTILGIFLIINLSSKESTRWFEGKNFAQATDIKSFNI
jgi:hypothetical protein